MLLFALNYEKCKQCAEEGLIKLSPLFFFLLVFSLSVLKSIMCGVASQLKFVITGGIRF